MKYASNYIRRNTNKIPTSIEKSLLQLFYFQKRNEMAEKNPSEFFEILSYIYSQNIFTEIYGLILQFIQTLYRVGMLSILFGLLWFYVFRLVYSKYLLFY